MKVMAISIVSTAVVFFNAEKHDDEYSVDNGNNFQEIWKSILNKY